MFLRQVVIMMTNQNSLETEYPYNDQSERFWDRVLLCWPIRNQLEWFWDRVSLCWPIRTILRQSVIVLTNQISCISASLNALVMLLLLLAHARRVEEKLWEWASLPTMFVLRVQLRESVSLYPRSCLPRSTFLTFLFPPQVFLAPSIERI